MNIHLIGKKLLSNLLTGTGVMKLHVEKVAFHFFLCELEPTRACARASLTPSKRNFLQPGNPAAGVWITVSVSGAVSVAECLAVNGDERRERRRPAALQNHRRRGRYSRKQREALVL